MRHAPEYWLLTNLVLNQIQQPETRVSAAAKNLEDTTTCDDDTGMSQLNALVAEFRIKL